MSRRRQNTDTHIWKKLRRLQSSTACIGDTSDLVAGVARRYLCEGDHIADVTVGGGSFWRKVDLTPYRFYAYDAYCCSVLPYDATHLPYVDKSMDVVALDPPRSVHPMASTRKAREFLNDRLPASTANPPALALCLTAMDEACRVLRPGGLLWVKCRDTSGSNRQYMEHIAVHNYALDVLGLSVGDLFIQVSTTDAGSNWHRPAPKNHRYLWVFRKAK